MEWGLCFSFSFFIFSVACIFYWPFCLSHDHDYVLMVTIFPSLSRFWLENIDPVFNFRANYWLGKTEDVEDKEQVGNHAHQSVACLKKMLIALPFLSLPPFVTGGSVFLSKLHRCE